MTGAPAPRRRAPGDVLVHLRRARDHMDAHYTEPIDLALLGETAGLSKWHFHRLFTATYGVTPAAYLSRRRLERAQDLLRGANLTVTEVCHAVGFSSLGSFSARFTELVGETPSAFQARWGGRPADPRVLRLHVGASREATRRGRSEDRKPGEAGHRRPCLASAA